MIRQLCKLVLVSTLGLSFVGCTAVEERSSPPYFPIGEKCALPDISAKREALQTAVMERLAAGIDRDSIEDTVFETGVGMIMMCPSRGERILQAKQIPLYLTYRHLEPAKELRAENDGFCASGNIYTAIVSSMSPERLYGELSSKIQCVAVLPETVLTYGVRVCVQDGQISDLDIRDVREPIFEYGSKAGTPLSRPSPYCH